MTLFLLTFFLLYGSLHLYAFQKARAAFAFGTLTSIWIAGFMLMMIVSPIIVRLSETAGFDLFARLMSYSGYTWMGVLFLFASFSLVIDMFRLIIYSCGFILRQDLSYLAVTKHYAFFIPLTVSIGIAVYGYFEAGNIRTENLTIKSHKIPAEINRVRIAQISDVHLGLIVKEDRLKRILAEVKKADPDILVSTGDLVDGQINNLSGLAAMLREINPRLGKYAITGNHEFYAGLDQSLNFSAQAGFTMLRGERVDLEGITIAGVDDPQARSFGLYRGKPEKDLLSEVPDSRFILLLKHRPLVDGNSRGLFDLQISGHVHRGQIFPFSIITGLYYQTQAGFATLSDGSSLYVSRGSGTWGPPIRFLSPPEVTVIDLVHAE
ncbi:MAG: metallophosphoesterase [Thermodesulfovibrionales bacterium]|nr:metallophosphoesterase [Thermodesulfovibrionales bacterium]